MSRFYFPKIQIFFFLFILSSCNDAETNHSLLLNNNKKVTFLTTDTDKITFVLNSFSKDTLVFFSLPVGDFFFFSNNKLVHTISARESLTDTLVLGTFSFPLTIYSPNAVLQKIIIKTPQDIILEKEKTNSFVKEKKRTKNYIQNMFSYYLYIYMVVLAAIFFLFSKNSDDLLPTFSIMITKGNVNTFSYTLFITLLQFLLSSTIGFFLVVLNTNLSDNNQNEMWALFFTWFYYSGYCFLFFFIRQGMFSAHAYLLHHKILKLIPPQYVKINFMMSLFFIFIIFIFFYVSPSLVFFMKTNIFCVLFLWGLIESLYLYYIQKNDASITKIELLYCLLSIEIIPLLLVSKKLQIFIH